MENGFRVLQLNPAITTVILSLIVWYLQKGPLSDRVFKRPQFILCLISSLILVATNGTVRGFTKTRFLIILLKSIVI